MQVRIVFNTQALDENLLCGWGFSCLVNETVLFDTGEKEEYLFNNMHHMGIDVSKIKMAVISHDHWDHTGGLGRLLKERKGLKVYGCAGFSEVFKERVRVLGGELIESSGIVEIEDDIFVTGEIAGEYKGKYMPEQALVLRTKNGISLITGCAHPGIINMLKKVQAGFADHKIHAVFGGFHLMDTDKRIIDITLKRFKEMSVKIAGPTHCSGKEAEAIFKAAYADDFIELKAGSVVDI